MMIRLDDCRATAGRRPAAPRRGRVSALLLATALLAAAAGTALGQAADRVVLTSGQSASGKVLAVTPVAVDLETAGGETQKFPVENVREVQFGAEPESLRSARGMLMRGRGADALDEVGKIEANELEGAAPLVLAEVDFVKAAAAGRAALDAGGDVAAAGKGVAAYLAKHGKSHHLLQMQELQGDLLARAGKADEALAAYAQLAAGPGPAKVRAAAAKGALLLSQGKADAALAEYESAIKLAGADKGSDAQKRAAELGKARCLAAQGKQEPALALVNQVIKDSAPEEKDLLARAYNVLGGVYRSITGKEQDALISFLTVDLVYNSVPDSHAEALYNLGELWERGSNPERAREARQNLKTSYPVSPWSKKLDAAKS
jgi:tetratricopeptide (TPR) repeat protein